MVKSILVKRSSRQNPRVWTLRLHLFFNDKKISICSLTYVSGGEEKIFRVFQAPSSFVESFKNVCDVQLERSTDVDGDLTTRPIVVGATRPELGLSNQKMERSDGAAGDSAETPEQNFVFQTAPTNDQLAKFSLFPEIHKIYGHVFEVYTICVNPSQTIVATACKASHEDHATILIWDVKDWRLRTTLRAHHLTVTQLAFSPHDQLLLSVSRDRTWNLFKYGKHIHTLLLLN